MNIPNWYEVGLGALALFARLFKREVSRIADIEDREVSYDARGTRQGD
jgi:hypothetical protein